MRKPDVNAFLPLKPNWLHILLTLADQPHHGYAIMHEVAERTNGKIHLWPATLYGTIRKLEDLRLVEPVEIDLPDDDERRQYYDITQLGRRVLGGEVKRLEDLVRLAHSKGVARA
jgi:DNA-binding PadR family transcriptional regulator